ncbi:hypothetical protein UlMin_035081 [Ulmus minor]
MAMGSYLALDGVNILAKDTRKHLNTVVFYVFNPALVSSNLSRTITYQRNLGNMLLIIVPTLCKEKGSPFGDLDVCHTYGQAYASLSMAVGAIYLWSYVYNLVQIYSRSSSSSGSDLPTCTEPLLSSLQSAQARNDQDPYKLPSIVSEVKVGTTQHLGIMHHLGKLFKKLNLKALFAPSTTAAILGFAIGIIPQIRNTLIASSTPLRVLQDTASLLGSLLIVGEEVDTLNPLVDAYVGEWNNWPIELVVGVAIVLVATVSILGHSIDTHLHCMVLSIRLIPPYIKIRGTEKLPQSKSRRSWSLNFTSIATTYVAIASVPGKQNLCQIFSMKCESI